MERSRYSIYVHIPFCKSRCIYCDFNTTVLKDPPLKEYCTGLSLELCNRLDSVDDRVPVSVYVGGGTPSLLEEREILEVLRFCGVYSGCDFEVTVEVNPRDVGPEWLKSLAAAGVNRLSVGVQAVRDERLVWMGRRHDTRRAKEAFADAREAGFENISVDFIFGTPDQTVGEMEEELEELAQWGAEHISAYELTFSSDSRLAQEGQYKIPDDALLFAMWKTAADVLKRFGYSRYEVSNFSRPGRKSRHNCHYWDGGEYIGVGAGATGFIYEGDRWLRYFNTSNIDDYLQSVNISSPRGAGEESSFEELDNLTLARELVMLGLRRVDGIDRKRMEQLLEVRQREVFEKRFRSLQEDGYLVLEKGRIVPTEKGMQLADELAANFF